MRTLSALIVSLALLSGCSGDSELTSIEHEAGAKAATVLSKAGSETVRDVVAVDLTVPSACLDEMVHLEGPVQVRIHTTVDGRGVFHQTGYYHWKDVIATGIESGHTWHTTAGLELYTVMNYELGEPFQPAPTPVKLGDPAVFHHTGAIRFNSDDGQPDLYVRHLVQIVTDPDGNTTIEKDHFELLACN